MAKLHQGSVRDARLGPIGGGTDEIMKEIGGKTTGLQVSQDTQLCLTDLAPLRYTT